MAADNLLRLGIGLAIPAALAFLGYLFYQLRIYERLRRIEQRLRDLKAGQRQVYHALDALQSYCNVLLPRVPRSPRPEPYGEEDRQAIVLRNHLERCLGRLHEQIQPFEMVECPRLAPGPLLLGRYHRVLRVAERTVNAARALRQALAAAEALADELEAVLARLARKPSDVQHAFADVRALADALSEEVELQQHAGAEGLLALLDEVRTVRATADEWAERLRQAHPTQAAELAIDAEAVRPQLLARITALYGQAGAIAGIHDQAQRALERLGAAIATIEERVTALRAALAEALQPSVARLQARHNDLLARYRGHEAAAYEQVTQEAWALVAQARTFDRQLQNLVETDRRAAETLAACEQLVIAFRRQIEEEESASGAMLDLARPALERAERHLAQMQNLMEPQVPQPNISPEVLGETLSEIEALGALSTREITAARKDLETWHKQRRDAEELLAQLGELAREEQRSMETWRLLQSYERTNWAQVSLDWPTVHGQQQQELLDAATRLRTLLTTPERLAQSQGGMLATEVETLRTQWETWSREGQRLATMLGRVQAAERQVCESLEALRPDIAELTRVEKELAVGKDTEDLRRQCRELLVSYARLCAEAQQPASADYRRLREEGLAQLHERLAFFRLTYQQTVDEARAALKRPLTELWERWEPLSEKISRAIPPSQTNHQALTHRWEALVLASRSNLAQMSQVLALQTEIETFSHDLDRLEAAFKEEREQIHQAEVELARERRSALQLRECLPSLLTHSHPQIVAEEWERSTRAWRKGEGLVRRLEPRRSLQGYLERLEEAATAYREARERARSAMVRLLRYALLEDPEGMHQACLPMGSGWSRLGMTSRDAHIRDLLAELEQAGQLGRLVERVSSYFLRRSGAASG